MSYALPIWLNKRFHTLNYLPFKYLGFNNTKVVNVEDFLVVVQEDALLRHTEHIVFSRPSKIGQRNSSCSSSIHPYITKPDPPASFWNG